MSYCWLTDKKRNVKIPVIHAGKCSEAIVRVISQGVRPVSSLQVPIMIEDTQAVYKRKVGGHSCYISLDYHGMQCNPTFIRVTMFAKYQL